MRFLSLEILRMVWARSCQRLFLRSLSKVPSKRWKVYVTGIQPTGIPHIGNYLGFIQNIVQLQNEANAKKFLFIADFHAIAVGFLPPAQMHSNIIEMAAALLACGIDPDKTVFFQQSQIPQHTELAWILGGFQTITALQHMPQYKDKAKRFKKGAVPVGLMCYPLLQAADVLLYRASHIPVGEDQNQHLNIIRHMAQIFNSTFHTEYFTVPEKVFSKAPRVRSLRDPAKKMSKSDTTDWSRILLSDSSETIFRKCKRATSDTTPEIFFDPVHRPAISNLISLNALFSERTVDEVVEASSGMNTVEFKESLAHVIDAKLAPIRANYEELLGRKKHLSEALEYGNEQARKIAAKNIAEIKAIVGFG